MKSIKQPDGSYVTTPVFVGGVISDQFTEHESLGEHRWVKSVEGAKREDCEYYYLEVCSCGATRCHYKPKVTND